MEQKQNKSTTSNCKVIRIVLQCNAGINIITCFEVSGGYCTALLSTHPCRLQVCRRGVEGWGVLVQAYLPNLKIIANQARVLLILGKSLLYRWFVHLVFVPTKALIAVTVMAIIVVNKGLSSQCRLFVVCCPRFTKREEKLQLHS